MSSTLSSFFVFNSSLRIQSTHLKVINYKVKYVLVP